MDSTQNPPAGPAVIQSGSVKVRVVAGAGPTLRRIELQSSTNFDQTTLKGNEFCPIIYRVWSDSNGNGIQDPGELVVGSAAEIRLSRYDPPRPNCVALFNPPLPAGTPFQLEITYGYRRNFTYDLARDTAGNDPYVNDVIKMDYSTRGIQELTLALQGYVDLEPSAGNPNVFVLPTDQHPIEMSVREQIVVKNMGS